MSGKLDNLTSEQKSALKAMLALFPPKDDCTPIELDDHKCDLLRFLRARKFDVEASEQMLKETLAWRAEVGADEILNDPEIAIELDPVFHEVISHNFHKYDKKGRPIYYEMTGAINMPQLIATFTPEQLIRRHIWYMERQIAAMKRSPLGIWNGGKERVEQMVHITDLKNLSLNPASHMSIVNVFKETTRIDQTYYPERMGKMVMVRAPTLFFTIWKMVAPLLDSVTKEKIVILGDNFQEELLEIIDADQLPVEYGGTCSCPSGCIPIHLHNQVNVGAGSIHTEEFEVGTKGATLSWSFQTVSHDIAFGVVYDSPDGGREVLSPTMRHQNAASSTCRGEVKVEESGGVISVIFDNSFSYFTSKNVKYRFDVVQHHELP